ncbi:MAG: RluA family pseudouridine synthase, partial [Phycisphaerae bacterium]
IICHPAKGSQTGTLANSLAHYAGSLSHGDDPFRPGIVHRLDKNTTGVMVVAKTDEAHWRLALQFERRSVLKTYLGVVEKPVALDADIIDAPIAAHPRIKDRYLVPGSRLQADLSRQAVTRYEVVRRFRHYTLVRLYPKTGRTHQLRVHMSYIGHPLAGDRLYGGHCPSMRSLTGSGSDEPIIERQALHAWRIRFIHPVQERPFEIEAPLPDDLQDLIAVLERHEGG